MKFGKNLLRVVELSNPEWGPFWINYKYLKKLINEIVESQPKETATEAIANKNLSTKSRPDEIAKSTLEVQFFSFLRKELKKSGEFFKKAELEFKIRWERIWEAYLLLKDASVVYDRNTWARLLSACVKFYKDVLLLENFAIMNYCGFSKILKKHDKITGFVTRDAFMKNVVNQQNITTYPDVLDLIKRSEQLFRSIQAMETVVPLQAEEKLFIEAIIGLNYQASRMQAEEQQDTNHTSGQSMTSIAEKTEVRNKPSEFESHHRNLEISENLDTATDIFIDAAAKLNYQTDVSPNLNKVLSWMELVQGNHPNSIQTVSEKEVNTDEEENDTLIVSKKLQTLGKRSFESTTSDKDNQISKEPRNV